jgi:hypothetical protein
MILNFLTSCTHAMGAGTSMTISPADLAMQGTPSQHGSMNSIINAERRLVRIFQSRVLESFSL